MAVDAVEVLGAQPAEHDVGGGLGQALALDDALAVVVELACAEERLQDRCLSLLELEEQRVLVVASHHQRDPRAGADAADADDLARRVDVAEPFQQPPPIARERLAIGAHDRPHRLLQLVVQLGRDELVDRHDARWVVADPQLAVHDLGQLAERSQASLGARLGEVLLGPFALLRRRGGGDLAHDVVDA